jgi:hypothetical protein
MSRRIFYYKNQSFIRRQLVTDGIAGSESTSVSSISHPIVKRGTGISLQQRAALRAARKVRATQFLESLGGVKGTNKHSSNHSGVLPILGSRIVWYLGFGIPTAIITWGYIDSNSPPAKFSHWIGFTDFIKSFTDEIAKPAHEKLLPDWSEVRTMSGLLFILLWCKNCF